jgi:hypothetical protein
MMDDLRIGDRVELIACTGPAGTVVDLRGRKVQVRFDDQPGCLWVLRASSLQSVGSTNACSNPNVLANHERISK